MRKTNEEIKKQIEDLKKERETIPEFSAFGDANWKGIDGQVAVLEKILKDDMDDMDVEGKVNDLMDMAGENYAESEFFPQIEAYDWAVGKIDSLTK